MALASLGTDTGGSVRIPAACCGLVGLKPGLGEVPTDGAFALSETMDHIGPIAQTVRDADLVYRALCGEPGRAPIEHVDIAHTRLALPRAYFCDVLDEGVRARFDEAIDRLRTAGASITEVEIPETARIAGTYSTIGVKEALAHHAVTLETVPWLYTEPVRQRLETGRTIANADYQRALAAREMLQAAVDDTLADADALVLPTLPIPAPLIGAATVTIDGNETPIRPLTLRETQLFNLTGHPAIALPCGRTMDGLPASIQFVGRQTDSLLALALTCERLIAQT
jgi:aspartyl-tRNA(Asn)/glutamyl-tRNA(Gln) amidotransferase subunit A